MEQKQNAKKSQKKKSGQVVNARKIQAAALYRMSAPSYKGEYLVPPRWIPGAPTTLTTAASVLSVTTSCDPIANITGFAARFGATFTEYRVLAVKVEVYPTVGTATFTNTQVLVWFDEANTNNPTSNEAKELVQPLRIQMSAYQSPIKSMKWHARDLNDLAYTPVATSFSPVTVKYYSDGTWGAIGAAVTTLGVARSWFLVEFRGLKST